NVNLMKIFNSLSYPWLKIKNLYPVTCCICLGKNKQEKISQFKLNKKNFSIMRCSKDKLMYLSPQPGKDYCNSLYNHPTYFKGTNDMYGLLINENKAKKIAKIRINELQQYAPKANSIFEIGCAHGHLLKEAKKQNFSIIKGIEFSKKGVQICQNKNLNVKQEDINNLSIKNINEKFDIVAAYSVLEHLNNPCNFLFKIKKFIKPKGLLVIRIPETDPIKGPNLSLLDHFWHFTKISIQKIMNKNEFKIKDIFESGTFYSTQSQNKIKNITIIAEQKNFKNTILN
ncbi:methyltransferase domain-containing protein, partial [Candidatus Wolfebacteria bacterium]|nr:methyltransferase domain-containing protein [Candidatus Wolfebacteria bacterium]